MFADRKWPRIAIYESWQPNSETRMDAMGLGSIPDTIHRRAKRRYSKGRSWPPGSIRSCSRRRRLLRSCTDIGLGKLQLVEVAPVGETPAPQRPEFTGGIGLQGAAALDRFVRDGKTLSSDR